MNKRRRSSVLDVRTYRSANCNSDHYLVKIKVTKNIQLNKGQRKQKNKMEYRKIKDEGDDRRVSKKSSRSSNGNT